MLFASRSFTLAKDTEYPDECQDAHRVDAPGGIAAVTDGVASAIFSRQWAEILADATITETPDPNDTEAFAHWLGERRKTWAEKIDTTGLAWFQKAKLPLGAFSTLLWVRLLPADGDQEGEFGAYRLRGFAIGDSCLFHVRHGEIVRTFPIQKAAELEAHPVVLGSVDLNRDELMKFAAFDELCYPDDLLVLCTDAIAAWALRLQEADNPPAWGKYWDMTQAEWEEEIIGLRHQRQMRYDDATLVLLCVQEAEVESEDSLPQIPEPPPPVREQAPPPPPSPPSLPPSPPPLPEVAQQPGPPEKKPDQKWWDKILGALRPGEK